LCDVQLFPKVRILEISIKAFRISGSLSVSRLKAVLDIRIRLQTHYPSGYPTGKLDSDHLWHGQDQEWISCRILSIFSDQDWIWIFIFEKNWIRTGSGHWFDFYNEIFLRVIQDVTNDGGSVLFAVFFMLSVCAAPITISGNMCHFTVNFFRPSGSSELLLYCWYAALFVVLNGICVCCVG